MSSSLPPGPPPSHQPPAGPPPGAETLERGGGGPIPPGAAPGRSGGGRGRRLLLAAGAVVGVGAIGGAAFGAWWYLSTGAQPAEALPAGTIGYVSIDLDPSGEQKIDALRTLKKFPAINEEFDLSGDVRDIDLKRSLVDELLAEAPCDLDYGDDIEPWLGSRGAVAAVEAGEEQPSPVFVLQVTDTDAALDGLDALFSCGEEPEKVGMEVVGDEWVLFAETPEIAADVAAATEKGSLADDETFQKWTEAAGDPGIVTMYAAPAAGEVLAESLGDLLELPMAMAGVGSAGDELDSMVPQETDGVAAALRSFEGLAVTIRFDGGSVEIESASSADAVSDDLPDGRGADALETLPDDTAAALGLGFADGWFEEVLTSVASSMDQDVQELITDLESASGLELPGDAETLAGDSAVLSLGPDLDLDALFESGDPSVLPIALKVLGDADAIEAVLDKIVPKLQELGLGADVLGTSSDGDAVAVGPDSDYRDRVVADGDLGDSDVYRDVVPDGDDSAAVFFVSFDAISELIRSSEADLGEELSNFDPLRALGVSGWIDDDGSAHALVRISTD